MGLPIIIPRTVGLDINSAQIWHVNLNNWNSSHFVNVLSNYEYKTAMKKRMLSHQNHSINSRGVLRYLLGNYLHHPPGKIKIDTNSCGKPFVKNAPIAFNVAHHEEQAIYAFTHSNPIGIDIEKIEQALDYEALAQRFFSTSELQEWAKIPSKDKLESFFRWWTHKEAILKMLGFGFTVPLSRYEISISSSTSNIGYLYNLNIDKPYIASLATSGEVRLCYYEL